MVRRRATGELDRDVIARRRMWRPRVEPELLVLAFSSVRALVLPVNASMIAGEPRLPTKIFGLPSFTSVNEPLAAGKIA